MIEISLTCTLPTHQTVYKAEVLLNSTIFLRDMNRSHFWENAFSLRQAWTEGYLLSDGFALPRIYQIVDGKPPVLEAVAAPSVPVGDFIRCGVRSEVLKLND